MAQKKLRGTQLKKYCFRGNVLQVSCIEFLNIFDPSHLPIKNYNANVLNGQMMKEIYKHRFNF